MIIGVDLSSRTIAMVGIDDGQDNEKVTKFYMKKLATKEIDRHQACNYLAMEGAGCIHRQTTGILLPTVFVEEPLVAGARNIRSSLLIAQTCGALLGAVDMFIPVYLVPVATWKKTTVGKGNADKAQVAAWLQVAHPSIFDACAGDQDLVDAACIALHGRHTMAKQPGLWE